MSEADLKAINLLRSSVSFSMSYVQFVLFYVFVLCPQIGATQPLSIPDYLILFNWCMLKYIRNVFYITSKDLGQIYTKINILENIIPFVTHFQI